MPRRREQHERRGRWRNRRRLHGKCARVLRHCGKRGHCQRGRDCAVPRGCLDVSRRQRDRGLVQHLRARLLRHRGQFRYHLGNGLLAMPLRPYNNGRQGRRSVHRRVHCMRAGLCGHRLAARHAVRRGLQHLRSRLLRSGGSLCMLDLLRGLVRLCRLRQLHDLPCGRHNDGQRRGQHVRCRLHGLCARVLRRRHKPRHGRRSGLHSLFARHLFERWRLELQRLLGRLLLGRWR